MIDISNSKSIVGNSSGEPDLKIYNIIVYFGYAESQRHAPLVFQHMTGFLSAKDALCHLHDTLSTLLTNLVQMGEWNQSAKDDYCDEDYDPNIHDFLLELQPSMNDHAPGGFDFWEEIQTYGWSYQGELVTGICITITSYGERMLSSRTSIENHCDAFDGKYVPYNGQKFALTPDIEQKIFIVSEIPNKKIK